MSESDPNIIPIRPEGAVRKKTKLSIFSEANDAWAFLDESSIEWEEINSNLYYYRPEVKVGILFDYRQDPTTFDSLVTPPEILVKHITSGLNTFSKAKSLRKLTEIL